MIIRKKGETDKQFNQRLKAYAENLEENNRALRVLLTNNDHINPKTLRTYKDEAQELFTTLGIINVQIREDNYEMAKIMTESQLSTLGFDIVDIATFEFLKDGAYNGQKSS